MTHARIAHLAAAVAVVAVVVGCEPPPLGPLPDDVSDVGGPQTQPDDPPVDDDELVFREPFDDGTDGFFARWNVTSSTDAVGFDVVDGRLRFQADGLSDDVAVAVIPNVRPAIEGNAVVFSARIDGDADLDLSLVLFEDTEDPVEHAGAVDAGNELGLRVGFGGVGHVDANGSMGVSEVPLPLTLRVVFMPLVVRVFFDDEQGGGSSGYSRELGRYTHVAIVGAGAGRVGELFVDDVTIETVP